MVAEIRSDSYNQALIAKYNWLIDFSGVRLYEAHELKFSLYPSARHYPYNNEVTNLNVSRMGNHGEWGAKDQVPCLVMAKKGRGNSESGR